MYHYIQCSNCGERKRISDQHMSSVLNTVEAGWRNCGNALYCPKCIRTWGKRNNHLYGTDRTTFLIICNMIGKD